MSTAEGVLTALIFLAMLVIVTAAYVKGRASVLPSGRSCVVCWDGQEAQTVDLPGAFPLDVEFQLAPTGGYVRASYTDKESR